MIWLADNNASYRKVCKIYDTECKLKVKSNAINANVKIAKWAKLLEMVKHIFFKTLRTISICIRKNTKGRYSGLATIGLMVTDT